MNNSIVSLSLFSLDKKISDVFETKLPSPLERLEVIKKLSENDVQAGLAVMPIIPFVTEYELEDIVKKAKEHKAKYILHEYLELKGDQRQIFINTLKKYEPEIVKKYEQLYQGNYRPKKRYISELNKTITDLCIQYNLKNKI